MGIQNPESRIHNFYEILQKKNLKFCMNPLVSAQVPEAFQILVHIKIFSKKHIYENLNISFSGSKSKF